MSDDEAELDPEALLSFARRPRPSGRTVASEERPPPILPDFRPPPAQPAEPPPNASEAIAYGDSDGDGDAGSSESELEHRTTGSGAPAAQARGTGDGGGGLANLNDAGFSSGADAPAAGAADKAGRARTRRRRELRRKRKESLKADGSWQSELQPRRKRKKSSRSAGAAAGAKDTDAAECEQSPAAEDFGSGSEPTPLALFSGFAIPSDPDAAFSHRRLLQLLRDGRYPPPVQRDLEEADRLLRAGDRAGFSERVEALAASAALEPWFGLPRDLEQEDKGRTLAALRALALAAAAGTGERNNVAAR
eukprot:tig00000076_g2432.t1